MVPGEGLGRGTDGQVGRQAWRGPPERAEASPGPLGLQGRLRAKSGKGADVRGPVSLANYFNIAVGKQSVTRFPVFPGSFFLVI